MRAREFIKESRTGTLQPDVARALPATYAITSLPNQDPYLQYRFGVALASAKGRARRQQDNIKPYERESAWGENEIIVSFDPNIKTWIDDAMNEMGLPLDSIKQLSTTKSEEGQGVDKSSPVRKFTGILGRAG